MPYPNGHRYPVPFCVSAGQRQFLVVFWLFLVVFLWSVVFGRFHFFSVGWSFSVFFCHFQSVDQSFLIVFRWPVVFANSWSFSVVFGCFLLLSFLSKKVLGSLDLGPRVYEKPKKESIFAQNVYYSMQNFANFFSQNVQAL